MQGVPITIVHKGDEHSGSLLLKVNRLDDTAEVLSQIQHEGVIAWMPAEPMTDREADRYLMEQISFDPDLWALEIEDKEGRHWFEGEILDL